MTLYQHVGLAILASLVFSVLILSRMSDEEVAGMSISMARVILMLSVVSGVAVSLLFP